MKTIVTLLALSAATLFTSCEVMITGRPEAEEESKWKQKEDTNSKQKEKEPERISFKTSSMFPFQNNSNWWKYSEPGGNSMTIEVTDTISDDNILFYRVSFKEHRVDTTDDWFQQSSSGTRFSSSLTGTYYQFLPSRIDAKSAAFKSNSSTVTYTWHETIKCDAGRFSDAVALKYSRPIIHGFDEIILADSIGIVHLTDFDARWTVDYSLDSCSIDGTIHYFKGY